MTKIYRRDFPGCCPQVDFQCPLCYRHLRRFHLVSVLKRLSRLSASYSVGRPCPQREPRRFHLAPNNPVRASLLHATVMQPAEQQSTAYRACLVPFGRPHCTLSFAARRKRFSTTSNIFWPSGMNPMSVSQAAHDERCSKRVTKPCGPSRRHGGQAFCGGSGWVSRWPSIRKATVRGVFGII